jgi:hypothetical protein
VWGYADPGSDESTKIVADQTRAGPQAESQDTVAGGEVLLCR